MAPQGTRTRDLMHGINEPEDANNLTDLEKKHLPVIEAPESVGKGECFEVTIEVGRLLAHPNEPGHFIGYVDLYADDTFLSRTDLTPVKTCPKVRLCIALDHEAGELRAHEGCNMHGVWVGRKPITVRS